MLHHHHPQKGQPYNAEEGRRALASVFGLGLFDNVQVLPKQSPKDETRIDVDVMVRERPLRTAEINAEWGFAPGPSGRPSLTSIVPGMMRPCVLQCVLQCVLNKTVGVLCFCRIAAVHVYRVLTPRL